MSVVLHVYDLSNGLCAALSQSLTGQVYYLSFVLSASSVPIRNLENLFRVSCCLVLFSYHYLFEICLFFV